MKIDEQPSNELRERIEPYLYEAGLDIDHLKTNARLIGQDLMLYQVIHKRKLELDDIKKVRYPLCTSSCFLGNFKCNANCLLWTLETLAILL